MSHTAIIPLAGRGNRLRPITDEIPKALVKLGDRPIAEICVQQTLDAGITDFVFVVGYKGEQVKEHFKAFMPKNTNVSFRHQEKLDGTGGVLRLLRDELRSQKTIVAFGDSLFAVGSIQSVLTSKEENTFAVVSVHDPERYGVVVRDQSGYVIDVEEKPSVPKSNLVIGGVYKFDQTLWDYVDQLKLSPRGEYELPDVIRLMIEDGRKISAKEIPYMYDVGTIAELERLNGLISAGELSVS